jgi:SAM domain (Sterile alpha motif)
MNVVVWLRSLGLGRYEAAFRENEIDKTVLPGLTAEDLKELGVQGRSTHFALSVGLCRPSGPVLEECCALPRGG